MRTDASHCRAEIARIPAGSNVHSVRSTIETDTVAPSRERRSVLASNRGVPIVCGTWQQRRSASVSALMAFRQPWDIPARECPKSTPSWTSVVLLMSHARWADSFQRESWSIRGLAFASGLFHARQRPQEGRPGFRDQHGAAGAVHQVSDSSPRDPHAVGAKPTPRIGRARFIGPVSEKRLRGSLVWRSGSRVRHPGRPVVPMR